MLSKTLNPALANSNSINTDHGISSPGMDTALMKKADKAGQDRYWVIDAIHYSYNNRQGGAIQPAPVMGGIEVKDGDKVIFDLDLPNAGGVLDLYLASSPGNNLMVTLKSGGVNVVGKINIITHIEASA